ncbi:hypothetical protein RRG08_011642 [Elysia crispata]|uniref:Uncharacterized protein n=1 Tax=Elysia crispata TaxID=231223 RepID=A0AAE1D018_9GAST|nr:hypothetical protein RRG08_011642 [Elysia crispata]
MPDLPSSRPIALSTPPHLQAIVYLHHRHFRHGAAPKSLDTPRDRRQPMASCLSPPPPSSLLPVVLVSACVHCLCRFALCVERA